MRLIGLTCCLALSACATQPLANVDGNDAGSWKPAAGAYRLTETITHDECSPRTAAQSPQLVSVAVGPDVPFMRVQVPEMGQLDALESLDLKSESFANEENVCGARLLLAITSHDASGFTIAETETWTNLAHAASECQPVPTTDCSRSATLRYDLVIACVEPCLAVFTPFSDDVGSARCECLTSLPDAATGDLR